jgi:hypothetical protein
MLRAQATSVLRRWARGVTIRPMSTAHILPADQAHLHYEELRFTVRRKPQRQLQCALGYTLTTKLGR